MITNGKYGIYQEINRNRIIILLPQTLNSITSTAQPISNRRLELTTKEEVTILNLIKTMLEKEEEK